MTKVEWTGVDDMIRKMDDYIKTVNSAVLQVATFYQGVFESYAKENAPWTDRTANARQTLHAWVNELSSDTVELYLAHGVDYGKFLEVSRAGKYAIIWPTIQAHLKQIEDMLKGIFG